MFDFLRPGKDKPKSVCPRCDQQDVVLVILPEGTTVCFRCIRDYYPITYQDLHNWLIAHPPLQNTQQVIDKMAKPTDLGAPVEADIAGHGSRETPAAGDPDVAPPAPISGAGPPPRSWS